MGAFNIPLMVDKPEFETQPQAQAKALGLKQLANMVAMQPQQQKLNDLRIQQDQLDVKAAQEKAEEQAKARQEADTLRKIHLEVGGDLDKLVEKAKADPSIRLDTINGLEVAAVKKKAADMEYRTNNQKLTDEQINSNLKKKEWLGESLQTLLDTPKEDRGARLEGVLKNGLEAGMLTPEQVQQYSALDVSDDHLLTGAAAGLRDAKKFDADEKARRTAQADRDKQAREEVQSAAEEAARSFSSVTDQASYDEWRNALPEKVGGRDFRRQYPKSYDAKVNGGSIGQHVARLARTQAQQDAYEEKMKVKPDANPNDLEAISAGLRAQHPEWSADKVLGEAYKKKRQDDMAEKAATKSEKEKKDPSQARIDELQKNKDSLAADAMAAGEASKAADEEIDGILEGVEGKDRNEKMRNANEDIRAEVAKAVKKRNDANQKVRQTQANFNEHDKQQNELISRRDGKTSATSAASKDKESSAAAPQIDPSIKESKGHKIGGTVVYQGKEYKIKGFTKSGNIIPEQ